MKKEVININELGKKLLLKDGRQLLHYSKEGTFPPYKTIQDQLVFPLEDVNRYFGVEDIRQVDFIDVPTAAKLLNISPTTLRSKALHGEVPSYRIANVIGSKILFDRSQLLSMTAMFTYDKQKLCVQRVVEFIQMFFTEPRLMILLSPRDADLLRSVYVDNTSLSDLSAEYDLTPDRIRVMIKTAERRLYWSILRMAIQRQDIQDLHARIRMLQGQVKALQENPSTDVPETLPDMYLIPLDSLSLPLRVVRQLSYGDITTVGDVVIACQKHGYTALLRFRNFGTTSLNALQEVLKEKFEIDIFEYSNASK